jgi:stalled ribosome rescue protein Dom34
MTHAVVWIDHTEARIFHVHPDDARHFFDEVGRSLDGIDSVLIVGPASAKHEFFKFAQEKHTLLVSKIVGVETSDHPTGGEIVAHARRYFKASDRMGSVGADR